MHIRIICIEYNVRLTERKGGYFMTVKELKNAIRWANIRISEAYEKIVAGKKKTSKSDKKLVDRKIELMQSEYGKGRKQLLKYGFRGKRKRDLETQLSQFESFADYIENADSRTNIRKAEMTHRAYNTFKKTYGFKGLNYGDYKDIVTIFGAVGEKTVNQFGSNNLIELFTHADDSQKVNFMRTMVDVLHDSKGQGWTSEELYDEMLYRLDIEDE